MHVLMVDRAHALGVLAGVELWHAGPSSAHHDARPPG
jgi:2,4-dienoyl-CoA reductase-like NADH-dependent reductase (Old Yellow Enzyme family)